jgi:hypothetical protein
MQAGSTSPRRSASWWGGFIQQLEQNLGAVMVAAAALALLLIVSFVGVLNDAVRRGEMKRSQQYLASSASPVQPVVVVARGR